MSSTPASLLVENSFPLTPLIFLEFIHLYVVRLLLPPFEISTAVL